MEEKEEAKYFLKLSESPVTFEPVSKITNVFFDETNKQLFTVRSGGVTGVQVIGPTEDKCHSFRMSDKGQVFSIKLSPSQTVLALQRSKSSVEFMNLKDKEEVEYSQTSKFKNASVLGFVWSQSDEVIIVTDQGVELFQVVPEKRILKALRNIAISLNWFLSCPKTKLLLLASGPASSNLQPISYQQPGVINKLPKFQVDIPVASTKGTLPERDVTLCELYGKCTILILRHPPRPPGLAVPGTQVLVYTMHKTLQTVRKTHILCLECNGRFAINVVDNLIIVHHQASRTSLLFDTAGGENDETHPITLKPIVEPCSIRQCTIDKPEQDRIKYQLYSANWVVFQPNIIIDAKFGYLWYIQVDLPALVSLATDPGRLVEVLLHRAPDDSIPLIIQVLRKLTDPCNVTKTEMSCLAGVFDLMNVAYRKQLNCRAQPHIATPAGVSHSQQAQPRYTQPECIVIDQSFMYSNIFSRFPELKNNQFYDGEYVIRVLLEYVRSLSDSHIPVQELNELIITSLMDQKHGLSRLHHLLQYRVLPDSKPLACTLLSLENVYPPALQLALDMLKRLGNADDEIVEILLHKQHILPTLRLARSAGLLDEISARKFLEAAKSTNDPIIFYSVFKLFEQRNLRLKGSTAFAKGELCEEFVAHFKNLVVQQSNNVK